MTQKMTTVTGYFGLRRCWAGLRQRGGVLGVMLFVAAMVGGSGGVAVHAEEASPQAAKSVSEAHPVHAFKLYALDLEGAKFWLPSVIVVKKGEKVKIHAESKVKGAGNMHGLAIEAFGVKELVGSAGKEIEFIADKVGVFDVSCHVHPAHVGGQLIVLDDKH